MRLLVFLKLHDSFLLIFFLLVSDDEDDNHSIRSVSSVHTSDLSSFEDDISISSEDENGRKVKKRVSLQLGEILNFNI